MINITNAYLIINRQKIILTPRKESLNGVRTYWVNINSSIQLYDEIKKKIKTNEKIIVNLKLDYNHDFTIDPVLDITIYSEKGGKKEKMNNIIQHHIERHKELDKYVYEFEYNTKQYLVFSILRKNKKVIGNAMLKL